MKYMENPCHKAGYKKEDLIEYARYRKNLEMEDNKKILKKAQKKNIPVNEMDEYRNPLSVNKITKLNILLSWGGDGDGYKLEIDEENNIIRGFYYWEDWGVYEEVGLTNEEIDNIVNIYLYGDISEYMGYL